MECRKLLRLWDSKVKVHAVNTKVPAKEYFARHLETSLDLDDRNLKFHRVYRDKNGKCKRTSHPENIREFLFLAKGGAFEINQGLKSKRDHLDHIIEAAAQYDHLESQLYNYDMRKRQQYKLMPFELRKKQPITQLYVTDLDERARTPAEVDSCGAQRPGERCRRQWTVVSPTIKPDTRDMLLSDLRR